MSKISIVIPAYNEEGYIDRLLKSIQKQSVQPFEVIVADNHSTDGTKNSAENFAKILPLKLVDIGEPRGAGAARNRGADFASGDVLLFLDSDVELLPNFLEDAVTEFEQRKLDLASAYFYVDSGSPKIDRLGAKAINLYNASFQYSKNPMGSGFCIFTKRRWHKKIGGFNESFLHSEDHDYVKRAVESGAAFRLLKSVRFKLSNRRYVHDGRFTILSIYTKAEINRIFFNYKYAPREEALYNFGVFSKTDKKIMAARPRKSQTEQPSD